MDQEYRIQPISNSEFSSLQKDSSTCPMIASSDCFFAPRWRSVLSKIRKLSTFRSIQDEKRIRLEAGADPMSGSSSEKRARYWVTMSNKWTLKNGDTHYFKPTIEVSETVSVAYCHPCVGSNLDLNRNAHNTTE
jgi:hypothetical protein